MRDYRGVYQLLTPLQSNGRTNRKYISGNIHESRFSAVNWVKFGTSHARIAQTRVHSNFLCYVALIAAM